MKTRLLLAFLALAFTGARAEDLTTLDGKQYTGVAVSAVEPDGLKITTDAGIEKIPFANLPGEVQKKYGYDQAKALQFQKLLQAVAAQRRASQAAEKIEAALGSAMISMKASVNQITDDGGLVDAQVEIERIETEQIAQTTLTKEVRSTYFKQIEGPVFIYGLPKNLVDGDSWTGWVWPAGSYRYTSVMGAQKTIRAFTTNKLQALKFLTQE